MVSSSEKETPRFHRHEKHHVPTDAPAFNDVVNKQHCENKQMSKYNALVKCNGQAARTPSRRNFIALQNIDPYVTP